MGTPGAGPSKHPCAERRAARKHAQLQQTSTKMHPAPLRSFTPELPDLCQKSREMLGFALHLFCIALSAFFFRCHPSRSHA